MLITLVCVGVIAIGCTLPADQHPRAIERDKLPELLAPNQSTTTTVAGADAPTADVYFVKDGQLVKVDRKVKSLSAAALLEQLAAGPSEEEQKAGISGSVPPNTRLLSANLNEKGLLTIDVTKDLSELGSPNNKAAYGQIVFTLIKSLGARQVKVNVAGEPKKIPTDSGNVDVAGLVNFTNSNSQSKSLATPSTGEATAASTPPVPPFSTAN